MRYLLDSDGEPVNTILIDDETALTWEPPEGLTLAAPGYVPPAPAPDPDPEAAPDYKAQFADATTDAAKVDVLAMALGLKDEA